MTLRCTMSVSLQFERNPSLHVNPSSEMSQMEYSRCGSIQGLQDCTCDCPRSPAGTGKNTHIEIRDVVSTFFRFVHAVVSGEHGVDESGAWRSHEDLDQHNLYVCAREPHLNVCLF